MAGTPNSNAHLSLTNNLRRLTRGATLVAALTSPSVFITLHRHYHWSIPVSLIATVLSVIAFRGLVDVLMRKLIPWPNIYGADDKLLQEEITARRRVWFWSRRYHWLTVTAVSLGGILFALTTIVFLVMLFTGEAQGWTDAVDPSLRDRHLRAPAVSAAGAAARAADADVLPREPADDVRAAALLRDDADSRLRARRRGMGREARRRPRPGRSEGRSQADRVAVAVERRLRRRRRKARPWAALPRETGHREDVSRQGDRKLVRLPVRCDSRLRLRLHVHRRRRDPRPLPRLEGEAARA